MTEIRPLTDHHEVEALAARCQVPFYPDARTYAAFENSTPLAICQFRIAKSSPTPEIRSIGTIDLPAERQAEILRLLEIGVKAFCLQEAPSHTP